MMRKRSAILQKITQGTKAIGKLGLQATLERMDAAQQKQHRPAHQGQVIDAQAVVRHASELEYQDLQQLFAQQLPSLTRQLLGARYQSVEKISRLVMPKGYMRLLDTALSGLVVSAQRLAATERVLDQVGEHQLQALQQDIARSQRASQAFTLQNQILAQVQGAICGAAGVVGAAIDLPISTLLALKTIYEIGHAYGFELDHEEDQQAILLALSQSNLALIAEKQAILLTIRGLKEMLVVRDYQPLQRALDSNYSLAQWQHLFKDQHGAYKPLVQQGLAQLTRLKYLTPVAAALVGSYYNHRLIEQVAVQASEIFATARSYLQQQTQQNISLLEAYHQQLKINQQQINEAARSQSNAVLAQLAAEV